MREGGSHIPPSFKFADLPFIYHPSCHADDWKKKESCLPFKSQRALSYSAQNITGKEETVQRRGGILGVPASLSLPVIRIVLAPDRRMCRIKGRKEGQTRKRRKRHFSAVASLISLGASKGFLRFACSEQREDRKISQCLNGEPKLSLKISYT